MKLFSSKTPLKILFVAPEASPFAKVGGLGSVMYSLPKALARLGHDARVMIPKYATIDEKKFNLEMMIEHLEVPSGNKTGAEKLICNVKKFTPRVAEDPVTTYFLENQEYYELRA